MYKTRYMSNYFPLYNYEVQANKTFYTHKRRSRQFNAHLWLENIDIETPKVLWLLGTPFTVTGRLSWLCIVMNEAWHTTHLPLWTDTMQENQHNHAPKISRQYIVQLETHNSSSRTRQSVIKAWPQHLFPRQQYDNLLQPRPITWLAFLGCPSFDWLTHACLKSPIDKQISPNPVSQRPC